MRIIFEYANRLTKRGHDVIVYSPKIPFNNYKGMIRPYYIRYRLNFAKESLLSGRMLPGNIFKYDFKIKHLWLFNNSSVRNADATVATSWTTSYVVNDLKSSKGKKFYLIQDYENWNSNPEYVNKSYTLDLNRITVSNYLRNFLIDNFNSGSEVILNGIDFNIFDNPGKIFKDTISNQQILFVDHILENKNTKDAIDVSVKLKKKFPEIKIKCFGVRNYHQLPSYIDFMENPGDEKIAKLYCESDIFLFTSKHEGFGLPAAESMSCKCALVGNAAGAIPEFAVNNESAILASPGNPEELFLGAEFLLNNPDVLKRISISGYESVRKILDWEKSVDKFEKLISS